MKKTLKSEPTPDAVSLTRLVQRLPSKERGCVGKTKLGKGYAKEADKLSKKWGKKYAVYRCPHCGDAHLTTKIKNRNQYSTEVIHITSLNEKLSNPLRGLGAVDG